VGLWGDLKVQECHERLMHRSKKQPLFNHLVGTQHERSRNLVSHSLGGLEVDHQLELGRLLDRQIAGL
jgi:hypothetical protein